MLPIAAEDIDAAWLLSHAFMVLSMQGGFALLEAGSVRKKNMANVRAQAADMPEFRQIMVKNLVDICVSTLSFWSVGWSFAYGPNGNSFIGAGENLLVGLPDELLAVWFFHFTFAATAATITSGAIAERVNLKSYTLLTTFTTAFSYPVVAHWIWSTHGWLFHEHFVDVAGGTVVHLTGSTTALVALLFVGNRSGRFNPSPKYNYSKPVRWLKRKYAIWLSPESRRRRAYEKAQREKTLEEEKKQQAIPRQLQRAETAATRRWRALRGAVNTAAALKAAPADRETMDLANEFGDGLFEMGSPVQTMFGAFVLWLGWFSFNAGSIGSANHEHGVTAARCTINTAMGSAFGIAGGFVYSLATTPDRLVRVDAVCNGLLSGLVSVTGGCAVFDPWHAAITGFLGAILCAASSSLLVRLEIDDPVSAVSVHGPTSLLGNLAIGLFARLDGRHAFTTLEGLFYSGDGSLLWVQFYGSLVTIIWSAVVTFIVLVTLERFTKFRVSRPSEVKGLDHVEHGIRPFSANRASVLGALLEVDEVLQSFRTDLSALATYIRDTRHAAHEILARQRGQEFTPSSSSEPVTPALLEFRGLQAPAVVEARDANLPRHSPRHANNPMQHSLLEASDQTLKSEQVARDKGRRASLPTNMTNTFPAPGPLKSRSLAPRDLSSMTSQVALSPESQLVDNSSKDEQTEADIEIQMPKHIAAALQGVSSSTMRPPSPDGFVKPSSSLEDLPKCVAGGEVDAVLDRLSRLDVPALTRTPIPTSAEGFASFVASTYDKLDEVVEGMATTMATGTPQTKSSGTTPRSGRGTTPISGDASTRTQGTVTPRDILGRIAEEPAERNAAAHTSILSRSPLDESPAQSPPPHPLAPTTWDHTQHTNALYMEWLATSTRGSATPALGSFG